jgi:hypothetical protein
MLISIAAADHRFIASNEKFEDLPNKERCVTDMGGGAGERPAYKAQG